MQVKIAVNNTTDSVEVPNDATVKSLKQAIHERFCFYEVKNQELFFNGVELQDNSTLESYQVINESVVSLRTSHKIGVIGRNSEGHSRRYVVKVDENATIGELKQKLHVDHGLDITNMKLQRDPNSAYLDDDTKLWLTGITVGYDIYIA